MLTSRPKDRGDIIRASALSGEGGRHARRSREGGRKGSGPAGVRARRKNKESSWDPPGQGPPLPAPTVTSSAGHCASWALHPSPSQGYAGGPCNPTDPNPSPSPAPSASGGNTFQPSLNCPEVRVQFSRGHMVAWGHQTQESCQAFWRMTCKTTWSTLNIFFF